MPWYLLALAFVGGLAFGSFANVIIHRVPLGLSIVKPGSSCPFCGRELGPAENIPVISFLFLKGRCKGCGDQISIRYPIIELLTGLLWVVLAEKIGLRPVLPAFLAFGFVLVVLAAIDVEHRRIPNRILGPAAIAGLVLLTAAALIEGAFEPWWHGLVGALAFGVPMFLLALAVPGGMGMGDVKLAAYLGLHLGWLSLLHVVVGAFGGFFIGSVAGVVFILAGIKGRKSTIPFGPSLAAGAIVAVLFGGQITDFWLGSL